MVEGKTVVLTGYDDAMSCVGDLTRPTIEEFAKYHNFSFECIRKYHDRMHPSFQKVEGILELFKTYDIVIWIDADSIITNKEINPLFSAVPGLNVSTDWGFQYGEARRHFSLGNFIATREAFWIFEWLLTQEDWYFKREWEQAALQGGVDKPWIAELIHIHPRRYLNSVDRAFDGNTVQEPWQPGDFLCHLSGRSNEERLRQLAIYYRTGSLYDAPEK